MAHHNHAIANMHILNFLLFLLININPFRGIMKTGEDGVKFPDELSVMLPVFQVMIVFAAWIKMGQISKRIGERGNPTPSSNAMEWFETLVS